MDNQKNRFRKAKLKTPFSSPISPVKENAILHIPLDLGLFKYLTYKLLSE